MPLKPRPKAAVGHPTGADQLFGAAFRPDDRRTESCSSGARDSCNTLEISTSEVSYCALITQVLTKIHQRDDISQLAPDKEFVVDQGIVKVGRYVPFSLEQELLRQGRSPLARC